MPGPVGEFPQVNRRNLGERRMVAVVEADHPLAGRDEISLADLAGHEMIHFTPLNTLRGMVDQAFAAIDVPLVHRIEVMTM